MIPTNLLEKIRQQLIQYNQPLFFFDNDVDGLASFLLLRRFCGKGKGVAIKSFPDLNASYARKINELTPDIVFILDKPLVANAFVQRVKDANLPLVWIDHHPQQQTFNDVIYVSPLNFKPPSAEPVSYWCYKIVNNSADDWIALLGCLSDWYIPDFATSVLKKYKDLFHPFDTIHTAAPLLYETRFGFIVKLLNFALKDRTSNIVKMVKTLVNINSPYELLDNNQKTKVIYRRFNQINKTYTKLLEKAKSFARRHVLFFQYGGSLSLSAELANELLYNFPDKVIVVAYLRGEKANISVRGKIDVRSVVLKAIEGLEATGGGHANACGATVDVEDLPIFKDRMIRLCKQALSKHTVKK